MKGLKYIVRSVIKGLSGFGLFFCVWALSIAMFALAPMLGFLIPALFVIAIDLYKEISGYVDGRLFEPK